MKKVSRRLRNVFKKGDRAVLIETGEKGTVQKQFSDGYVTLALDNGWFAELDSESLKKIESSQHNPRKKKRRK